MAVPKVISIEVTAGPDDSKLFKAPVDMWTVDKPYREGPEGKYYHSIHAGCLGSNRAEESRITEGYVYYIEEGSPCLLFRNGSFFDEGSIYYFGSQSDGYHLVGGFQKTGWQEKEKYGPPVSLLARWFELGDVIVIVYFPHPNTVKHSVT
jgi:hypothetical protein